MSGSPAELKEAKKRLRVEIRRIRDAIPEEERQRRAALIETRLFALSRLAAARTVMLFWSFGSEVPTAGLIGHVVAEGHRVALPAIVDGELEPRTYVPGDPVNETWFGAKEPGGGEIISTQELDVIVTPGLAFDRQGYRVGYGGGHYDRFLRKVGESTPRVGICFAEQVVGDVPHGDHDVSVELVVTDAEVIVCARHEGGPATTTKVGGVPVFEDGEHPRP